jgi:hypothetical protein
MKSEDELLIELRDSLARFAASTMKMQRVEVRDFPAVDPAFYDRMAARLSGLGFNPVGDFVPVTGHQSDGNLRCFIRAFVSPDGLCTAACYHPRPRLWIRAVSRVICGRLGKVVELETEFSDDTWVISTTAPKARLFDPPPLFMREHYPEAIEVGELFVLHQKKVSAYLASCPGVTIRKVYNVAGLERAQARQHDITAVYRSMVGGLTADEIRRFSVFGRSRSAALKERLSALQQETRQP